MGSGQQNLVKQHCSDLAVAKRNAAAAEKRTAREAKKLDMARANEIAHKEKDYHKKARAAAEKKAQMREKQSNKQPKGRRKKLKRHWYIIF